MTPEGLGETPMDATAAPRQTGDERLPAGRQTVIAAGSLFGALGTASCCIAPLVLFSLGAGGAWIGNLTALAPYQGVFFVLAFGFLGAGAWTVYRARSAPAAEGAVCARRAAGPWFKAVLWGAALLTMAALAFPYAAPLMLGG